MKDREEKVELGDARKRYALPLEFGVSPVARAYGSRRF